jgi:DNA-binding PadR family transcriptional regulator
MESVMKDLTINETIILLAIFRLDHEAYGVLIRKEVAKILSKTISYGTLYSYLEQLFRKGLINKHCGEPTPERGGRRKIFYSLTREGKKALKAAYQLQQMIWIDTPDFVSD